MTQPGNSQNNSMESITHALKTIFLLFLGVKYHGLLLGIPHPLWADAIFFTIYVWILYRYYMSYKPLPVPAKDFNVCIVGAGFSGINMAVKLKEIGVKYKIVEKSSRFGGTWWDNQYPGCACDVASHLYSYSFEPNPDWSQSYSPQPEIQEYLDKVAHKYDIGKHVEFGKKVMKTTWDETTKKWTIELDNGEVLTANVLVSGAGALHVPVTPDFKGKDSFKGDAFHSAHWKKGYDTRGKRVAVIGTGASSVQIVPSIAPQVKHLKVFQRTPCWVPPKDAYGHPTWLRFLFRVYPFTMFLFRNFFFWRAEFRFWATFRMEGIFRKRVVNILTEHTMTEVKNPEVAKKLIPSFEMGCKRVTPSNEYLQSFNRDNVTLVTDGIDSIVENGIKTKDGIVHEVDTIIYATGFSPIKSANAYKAYGMNGLYDNSKTSEEEVHMNGHIKQANGHVTQMNGKISLGEEWQDYPNAYKGITVPGYPNAFFLLGPGTGLGHNSVVYMIECQVAYTVDAIRNMIETDIKSVNVNKRANKEYQEWVQECLKNKVFNSTNCKSWYKNDKGVNYTLWPSHLTHYWWITRKFDLENYICKY